jgi:hypothetical protein
VLLALFSVGVLAQGWAMPLMEGSDESIHNTYMEVVRRENRLPDRRNVRENSTRQASGQAPLTYWLAAKAANLAGVPSTDSDDLLAHLYTIRNDWITPPDGWNRRDNLNHYFHGANESAFGAPDIITTGRFLRLTSLAYGVLAVIGAYGAARETFRRESWALTATVIFAFTPTLMHLAAYFNNDISAIAFATLTVWVTLRLLRLGANPRRVLVIGLLLALGALSKVSVLLIAPGVGAALLLDWWSRRQAESFGRLVIHAGLMGLPLLILFGPWVAWGWLTYGDPFGFTTHLNPYLSYTQLLTVDRVVSLLDEVYLSYWAKFGLAKVFLHPLTYTLLGSLLVAAAVGVVLRRFTPPPSPLPVNGEGEKTRVPSVGATYMSSAKETPITTAPSNSLSLNSRGGVTFHQIIVLAIITLTVFAGLLRWMQEIAIITGRLLYPAHIAITLGITGGLYLLARRFPRFERSIQGYTIGLLILSGAILSPVALHQAYRPPLLLSPDQLPALQGEPIIYEDTIKLLGFAQESPYLSGKRHTLTLCWEVLRSTDEPAAFSIKFVREGIIVADRTSIHGLGHFDSRQWQPGNTFCDVVDVALDDPDVPDDPQPQPGTVYSILVVLLNADTQAVDWDATLSDGTPIEFPFIGSVVSPAGDMAGGIDAESLAIQFESIGDITGYHFAGDIEPGGTLELTLLWRVNESTETDWTQFIHLVGGETGASISLADSPPRGGAYPTWAWQPGESIRDAWRLTLPDDLPPDDYTLQTGLYNQVAEERLPVTQGDIPLPDRAARVVSFTINE